MFTFLKKSFRRLGFTALTLCLGAFMGPTMYEAVHNEGQQDRVEAAMDKVVQQHYFTCDPEAAGNLKDRRDKKLTEVVNAAWGNQNPGWSKPLDLFQSGVKRLSNGAPATAKFFSKHVMTLSDDFYAGNYSTALDDLANYTTAIGDLGVGICFDTNLNKIGAGSAYTRDKGLISLNPDLSPGDLAEHARRQLQRLNDELVLPFERVVKTSANVTSSFDVRVAQLHVMVATLDGPVLILPLNGGARGGEFAEIPRKNYEPPLLKQPPAEQQKAAAPAPVPAPAPVKAGKGKVAAK